MTPEKKAEQLMTCLLKDLGVVGYIVTMEQLTWMFILRYLDYEVIQKLPKSSAIKFDEKFLWSNWACPVLEDGTPDLSRTKTRDELIKFVNDELFPYLFEQSSKTINSKNSLLESIYSELICNFSIFENSVVTGIYLREALNKVNDIELSTKNGFSEFSQVYEKMIQFLGREVAPSCGQFTKRPLVRAIVKTINPVAGESVYDAASGTCGFLLETLKHQNVGKHKITDLSELRMLNDNCVGRDIDPWVDLLGRMNMIFHTGLPPNLICENTLAHDIRKFTEKNHYDVVMTNLPYRYKVDPEVLKNFPIEHSFDVLLFLQHIMNSLKSGGRAAVIVPDYMLNHTESAYKQVRKRLLEEFNLHTVLSLPTGMFWPHSNLKASVLYFNRTKKTNSIWYYECDLRLRPFKDTTVYDKDFEEFVNLFNRRELTNNSWKVPYSDINENVDLVPRNPNKEFTETFITSYDESKKSEKKEHIKQLVDVCRTNLVRKLENWFDGVSTHSVIGELIDVSGGNSIPESESLQDKKTKYPYIQISDFSNDGSINNKNVKYLKSGVVGEIKSNAVSEEDLCISIVGTIGKVCIVPPELSGAILTDHAAKLTVSNKSQIDARYLYLFLLTSDFEKQARIATINVTKPKLQLSKLGTIKVPVCSKQRQLELINAVWKVKLRIDETEKIACEHESIGIDELEELHEELMEITHTIEEMKLPSENLSVDGASIVANGGANYDTSVKSKYATFMHIDKSISKSLSGSIKKMKFQGKIDGYNTDDLILFVNDKESRGEYEVIGHIEETIEFTKKSPILSRVVDAAWKDLNNPEIFSRGKDAIALVTNPLSSSVRENVGFLLELAKEKKGTTEFLRELMQSKMSSPEKRELYEVFKFHLSTANGGTKITDKEAIAFLNHFHILEYETSTGIKEVLDLIEANMPKFSDGQQNSKQIYSCIVGAVLSHSQTGSALTNEKLTSIVDLAQNAHKIAANLAKTFETKKEGVDSWKNHSNSELFVQAALIGSWSENNENDRDVLAEFLEVEYEDWLRMVGEIMHLPDSPISARDGYWNISNRELLIGSIGKEDLDSKLDKFKNIALKVLSQQKMINGVSQFQPNQDGTFEGYQYSESIRRGISEGVAILGNFAELSNKSKTSVSVSRTIVKELLQGADWRRWCTLNELLPNIAEAAPEEFLSQVFNALEDKSCPFDDIFVLDNNEIVTESFIKGLFWALESLAWDEKYLERVCLCLCELHNHTDQGERLTRPIKSLTEVLSPWLPGTIASPDLRKVVIRNIVEKYSDAGWSLLVGLLPSQKSWPSFPTYEPKWRKSKFAGRQRDTDEDYTSQMIFIAKLAVWMADGKPSRIIDLVKIIEVLPETAFKNFVSMISSDTITSLTESEIQVIWENLKRCISKHRQFPDADWTLSNEKIEKIETIAKMLEPDGPFTRYQYLFTGNDSDLFKKLDSWEKQEKELSERRISAVKELFEREGLGRVLEFTGNVESPNLVGIALAATGDDEIDKCIINEEKLLSSEASTKEFVGGYISERHRLNSWKWVESILKDSIMKEGTIKLLTFLPFELENWEIARKTIGGNDGEYWKSIPSNIYLSKSENLEVAVENLLNFDRPKFAVRCLEKMKRDGISIEANLCIRTLLEAKKSDEFEHPFFQRNATELIKHLQGDSNVNVDELSDVEWAYLQEIFEQDDVKPVSLYKRLSVDSEFFCEMLQFAYKSTFEYHQQMDLKQDEVENASKADKLLENWISIFDKIPTKFQSWLNRVRKVCEKSGHLEIALYYVGRMLSKVSADNDGLGISRSVAEILEKEVSADMHEGFRIGLTEDEVAPIDIPYGEFEAKNAEKFLNMANTIEKEDFPRVAETFRNISNRYKEDAEIAFSRYAAE